MGNTIRLLLWEVLMYPVNLCSDRTRCSGGFKNTVCRVGLEGMTCFRCRREGCDSGGFSR
jgi:hypothetical protein